MTPLITIIIIIVVVVIYTTVTLNTEHIYNRKANICQQTNASLPVTTNNIKLI